MQNFISKIIVVILFFGYSMQVFAQNPLKESLHIADSLFQEKKYTESLEIYETIFESSKKYSPSMLLKMAFIKEGLGDFSMALFYLDYYYQKTANKRVLTKMDELAEQNSLTGYEYSDFDLMVSYWHKYHLEIIVGLVLICLMLLSYFSFSKHKGTSTPSALLLLILFMGVTAFMINFGLDRPRGILISESTYIMKDPSSASDLVEIAGKGHKVRISGKEDVWYKIEWNDEIAWVREGNLILTHQ